MKPETRSALMSRVRDRNTKPEMVVRKQLFGSGLRYRLHRNDLPGKPDIVLPTKKVCIFVNGCFWHQHSGCKNAKRPSTNTVFWNDKLDKNKKRDNSNLKKLVKLGWTVIVIWECEVKQGVDFLKKHRDLLL